MNSVPIHELKRRLSQLIARAEAGETLAVTRHKKVVARIVPPHGNLHVGRSFGRGSIQPLLQGATRGRYLDVIADDRRGGNGG
jgi:prevent-host-death family protein